MGEPNSISNEVLTNILLATLDPALKLSAREFEQTGLHRLVLLNYFNTFKAELGNLTGWKNLDSFEYAAYYRANFAEIEEEKVRSEKWCATLVEHDLSATRGLLIYDEQEVRRAVSLRGVRLYLLRDGEFLFYSDRYGNALLKGDILTIFDKFEKSRYDSGSGESGFIMMMKLLSGLVEKSIDNRKARITDAENLNARLKNVIESYGK